jgi:hypothetical protein
VPDLFYKPLGCIKILNSVAFISPFVEERIKRRVADEWINRYPSDEGFASHDWAT